MTGKQSLGAFRRESVLQALDTRVRERNLIFGELQAQGPEQGGGGEGRASRAGPGLWWSPDPKLALACIKRLPGTVESSRCMTESWFTTSETPADSTRMRSQLLL